MNSTSIEWCNRPQTRGLAGAKTWNPIRARLKTRPVDCNCSCPPCARSNASDSKTFTEHDKHCGRGVCMVRSGTFCTRISPGCANCYASTINKRFGNGLEYTVPNLENVEFYLSEKILQEPLKQKKPCTIFVGDMFDLFHEAIPTELITQVLRVPDVAKQHTFQFLTKRAGRMYGMISDICACAGMRQPPSNMWFGVSVESQKYADERIPLLLETPAAIRFLSVEPQLEAVCLTRIPWAENVYRDALYGSEGVQWVICGGESGPHARPFNLSWAESLRDQCKAAGVAFFMKQLGSQPRDYREEVHVIRLKDRKGGDISEFPEGLRIREFPA